jgi:hypothetical protein
VAAPHGAPLLQQRFSAGAFAAAGAAN